MRKARSEESLRRMQRRRSGKLVLIVCEGAKTEPNYFNCLRKKWRLHPVVVEVHGKDCGTDPLSIVNRAIELKAEREATTSRNLPYDEVWCVFDREGIHSKTENLNQAKDKAKGNELKLAISTPCFEFWYLLHYRYTTHGFNKCKDVVRALKKHLPGYEKLDTPIEELEPRTQTALGNAEKLRKHNSDSGSNRPATDVDLLIKSLKEMRRR